MAKVNTYTVTYTKEDKDGTVEAEIEVLMEDGDNVDEELAKANQRVADNIVNISDLIDLK